MVLDLNWEQVDRVEQTEQHNLFRTRCTVEHEIFDVVIDGESHENFITRAIVHQLNLATKKHPLPYNLGKFKVTKCCRISFSIGKYKDEMLFDVVDMDACHIILGKPWVYDLNAIYNIEDNTYKFQHNGGRFILVPLMESNQVSEPNVNNSFIMGYQDFEEERKDEFLVNSTITTTMIQDETLNKIPEKLKSQDEVSQALIPDELQPILSPMQDITLPTVPCHNTQKESMVQNMELIHRVKKQHVEFGSEDDKDFCYKHCWAMTFEVGDLVMIDLQNKLSVGTYNKLRTKMIRPCQVLWKISSNAYVIDIPKHLSLCPIFSEDDMFEFQQNVPFFLGGNSRTSFFQEGENDAVRVGIG